jgi:hypothetical protein
VKILHLGPERARPITQFDSREARILPAARLGERASVHWLTIGPQGVVGGHPASAPQLFLVVGGSGWVRAGESGRVLIAAGEAAYWDEGEWHESGSEMGLTAVVIEGHGLVPAEPPLR